MSGTRTSEQIRAQLDHPVIDADGHVIEYMPLVDVYLREEGGEALVARYNRESRWYGMSEEQRRRARFLRPPWWAIPTRLTRDNATSMLPRLLRDRMGEMGLDFAVLYPTVGLEASHTNDEEARRGGCRAFNRYLSDVFGAYPEVMTPAAVIPMHTPEEAIDELEHVVGRLGFKAAVFAGFVRRPIGDLESRAAELGRHGTYIDTLALDSEYDYDPVWQKCIDLGIAPSFHSAGMGWGSRTSPSNYMYNHIGHFASASEALCKALFIGGVTRRFPAMRFAFLESGVGWATSLLADLVGHWEKRNGTKMANYDPANLDLHLLEELFREYADGPMLDHVAELSAALKLFGTTQVGVDEFAAAKIEQAEDIAELFVPNFFFGCEADDPINAWAFNPKVNPFGARLNAVFSSDIGHWDVPDMREVLEEAYELVDDDLISPDDFRDFTFGNAVKLFTGMNPNFFDGTSIESSLHETAGDRA